MTIDLNMLSRVKVGVWLAALLVVLLVLFVVPLVSATEERAGTSERLITIHDNGVDKGVITRQDTLREVFAEADIPLDSNDIVEPSVDEKLVASMYQVNIYRARPIIIIDGNVKQRVMSAYQTPKQIAEHADIKLQEEDIASLAPTNNILRDGASLQMTIDRAIPVKLILYGTREVVYTQEKTVAEFLKSKDIEIGEQDTLSVEQKSKIAPNMTIEVWRNGKQTVTEEEPVDFEVQQIQDADREVGYRKIKTPGVLGKKVVTYEVVMRNGREISRKEIQAVVTKQSQKQVEIVGAKPSFTGDFAAALAKLRSCEGGYDSWNPAGPYYGAYQFDQQTWNSVSNAPYGSATPAQQDAAAHALYLRRGWQPWPHCGASLPDIYR